MTEKFRHIHDIACRDTFCTKKRRKKDPTYIALDHSEKMAVAYRARDSCSKLLVAHATYQFVLPQISLLMAVPFASAPRWKLGEIPPHF
ncbi:hypothetical protein CEXT_463001 [Caerostris extrusa]|uniref:Uncharacterized protein n=1 Tax=Caerostris extrusa TaxID=172846 RepID=A0AAV4RLB3_CAEEX|nr:hypothetical protein CEXT_463001 [Caerostris extrusa]